MLDRQREVLVGGRAPREVEQASAELGERIPAPSAFVRELAEGIDYGASAFGWRRAGG